jgi:hypothetical protein
MDANEAIGCELSTEALRLGLAYEYDPFFALSIARVDPPPQWARFEYAELESISFTNEESEIAYRALQASGR